MIKQREISCGNCGNKYDDCMVLTLSCPVCCSSKNQNPR